MSRLLIVDDDTELCTLITEFLARDGLEAECVYDGEAGLERILDGEFDLVVLDVMLPGMSGFDVLRRLRESTSVPVIMLTARGEEVDRIVGLEMGADDYLAKPFNPRELSARIRAILRRSHQQETPSSPVVEIGDLRLDSGARTVICAGVEIDVTGVEFAVIEALVGAAGSVLSRDELSRQALGRRASSYDRSLDVHLSNLRRKLGPLPGGRERIKTVRGVGYMYVRPAVK